MLLLVIVLDGRVGREYRQDRKGKDIVMERKVIQ